MAAMHLPMGRQPHLPLLSQEEQQRLYNDVHYEQIQNGEKGDFILYVCFITVYFKVRQGSYIRLTMCYGHICFCYFILFTAIDQSSNLQNKLVTVHTVSNLKQSIPFITFSI